ncbi:LysR substrate-binding domain-containing protein [Sneathiella chinensis]|uniref:LysR family transcriptional regulator n=1 Tax=Sneathiella chinensis TaxID=349750 RepID=A0ABQ5U6K9_9PROT|nr:LysR substrate-binding domain-containing protein [Sneathiella chinensis]GLQ07318.1 LysR family transcriptional regulator [Sneathiella chinensis]
MRDQLPPLNALKAFESAGRYLNIGRAAEALGVSSGAVSQQVHALEKWIGCRLFQRTNKGLEFTEPGRVYFDEISRSFEAIRVATRCAGRPDVRKGLVISVTASFAMKFLLPRLTRFRDLWPDVDISVSTVELVSEYHAADGDVGIRYGMARQSGMWSREILRDELLLVAAPHLLDPSAEGFDLDRLRDYPLLLDKHPRVIKDYPSWETYLSSNGLADVSHLTMREFSQQWMVIEAAVNGEGVALAKKCLVQNDLDSGRLVALSGTELALESGYYLLTLPENANDTVIRSFRNWLATETAKLRGPTP